MLVVQAFLGTFLIFFVSYSSFIHNESFITSYVTICEIYSNMIISFAFANNHLVKMWPHANIMECQKNVSRKQYPLRNRSQLKIIEKQSGVTKIIEVTGLHITLVTFKKNL